MSGKRAVGRILVLLRDAYPELVCETEEQWSSRVDAYFAKLRRFDGEVVGKACDRAHDRYPNRFPTASQLASLCVAVDSEQRQAHRDREVQLDRDREDSEMAAHISEKRRTVIPDTRADQARWTAEGESPFERLARRWECESKNGGWDPNRPSPSGVGERRLKELMAALDDHGKFGTRADAKQSKPEPGWDG